MARFGRSVPPSTRLWRSTARYEGAEPRYLTVGVAGSEERARPVNRAIGEARTARELDTAPAVGRARARLVSVSRATGFGTIPFGTGPFGGGERVPTEETDQALALGGRIHRRTVAVAGESNSVPGITRKHRRDVGVAGEFETALPAYDKEFVSDAVFATAIENTDRQPSMVLRADWNRNGQFDHDLSDLTSLVETVTVERTLTSMLPAEVGLFEGYSSAALRADLSGSWPALDTMTAAEALSPYRIDSPLYGEPVLQTPVQLDTGFVTPDGERTDRRFTGTVRAISPRSSTRGIKFEALDPAHRLRRPITLPATGLYEYIMARYGEQVLDRINSQWLIDYILRQNGIYASPPPRPDAVLSVTGHGSLLPEIGFGGSPNTVYITYRGPIYGVRTFNLLAPTGTTYCRWWLQSPLSAAAGSGFGFSGRVAIFSAVDIEQHLDFNLTQDESWTFTFGIGTDRRPYFGADGPSSAEVRVSPTAWTPPSGGTTYVFLGFHVAFTSTTMTVKWRINGQEYTTTATIAARSVSWRPDPEIIASIGPPMSDWQVWSSATPPTANTPWWGEQWTSQADLDPGANELTGIPDILAEDSADLIKEIVAAEGSTFWFTESGRPQFRTRKGDELRGITPTVKETITADRNLADLVATTDESTIRNIVTLKTQQLLIGLWEDVYTAKDAEQFVLAPSTDTIVDVPLEASVYETPRTRKGIGVNASLTDIDKAAFVFYTNLERWRDAKDNPATADMIRLALVRDDNPIEITDPAQVPVVYIRVVRVTPWLLRLVFTNFSSFAVRLATPAFYDTQGTYHAPEPGLIVPGRRVHALPTQLESYQDDTSIALYGASTFEVGGGAERWKQDPVELRELAQQTLDITAYPVPVLDAVDIPHDPRRRLGDRVIVADPDGLGTVTATIVGLSTTYSHDGATDRVTVRPIAAPGQ